MSLPASLCPRIGLAAAALSLAMTACKRTPEPSPSAPPPTAEAPVAEPPPPPPPVVGWSPKLLPGESVIDVAGFAAVLTRREIPATENQPDSERTEYHILTKAGERLGPWPRVAAFAPHENGTYHAYVSTESYGSLTPLGLAVENPSAYPPPAGPSFDEPSTNTSEDAPALPGLELRSGEEQTTVVWQGKELGTWAAVSALTPAPNGTDLYFWAQNKAGGWDVFCNATALTQPDPQRNPLGAHSGEFATRFVFGGKPGELAYAENLDDQQNSARFGSWMVCGQKRWGPYMGFSPEFVWPKGASAPSFAAREGTSWTLVTGRKEYVGEGNYDSVDWFLHDTDAHPPIWSAKRSYSQVDEHQLLSGDSLVLRANAFSRPVVSADGTTLAFTAWYRPKSLFSMNSSTFIVLLPRSLHYPKPTIPPATTGTPEGTSAQPAVDPLEKTMRDTIGLLRLFAPPHAGPHGDIENLRLSANGHAVAFDVKNASLEMNLPEPHVFDGKLDMIGHLDPDGRAATLFKDGAVVRQTGL